MGKTRVVRQNDVGCGALGAVTHYIKFNIGASGAVTAGTIKTGGDVIVDSIVRAGAGRYTVTLNPQHVLAVAKIIPNLFTPLQTDYFVTPRVKAQGTDGIVTSGGVQSFEVMCSAVTTTSGGTTVATGGAVAADPVNGSQLFIEITEYITDAGKRYTVG